jgi:hypothetical protein
MTTESIEHASATDEIVSPAPQPPAPEPEIPVHPLAASFPMLEGEELDALVEDIRTNGLLHPIVRYQPTGELLDGRNRLKACELAGVEPRFTTTEQDPLDYIRSANITRRNLTKSQWAAYYAEFEEVSKGGRGKTAVSNTVVSGEYKTKARFVLKHAPDVFVKLKAGGVSVPKAYEIATDRRDDEVAYTKDREAALATYTALKEICLNFEANVAKWQTAYVDQGDFTKQVHADGKTIIEHAQELVKI